MGHRRYNLGVSGVDTYLRLALIAVFLGAARFAGSGEWDALLLPAWPLFFAAVAWCSIDPEA